MKNLLIVGYYCLSDGFKACANYLSLDYNVTFFPLMEYEHNNRDYMSDLISKTNQIDIVLLWYHRYFIQSLKRMDELSQLLNQPNRPLYCGYSWDPMSCAELSTIYYQEFVSKIDYFITGDSRQISHLNNLGLTNVYHARSGCDPRISVPIKSNSYNVDVSFILTNLYTDSSAYPPTKLTRQAVLDTLYQHHNEIKLAIYGPEFLGTLYPDCYKGYIKYDQCNLVFHNSKINLCFHVAFDQLTGQQLYFSERLPQILASKGLLYCNTKYDELLIPGVNYVLADPDHYLEQIIEIINNWDQPVYQTIIDNGYQTALNNLTWDHLRQVLITLTEVTN